MPQPDSLTALKTKQPQNKNAISSATNNHKQNQTHVSKQSLFKSSSTNEQSYGTKNAIICFQQIVKLPSNVAGSPACTKIFVEWQTKPAFTF